MWIRDSVAEPRKLGGVRMNRWVSGPMLGRCGDLWELLRSALATRPDAEAVTDPLWKLSLTGRKLLREVESAAGRLWSAGARPGDRVLIDLPHSVDEVVNVLACVRQGFTYVGVDQHQPVEARARMVEDCQPRLAVTTRPAAWEPLTTVVPGRSQVADQVPHIPRADEDPCYISYTSGTTGRPRGVEIPRAGVDRLVRGSDYCALDPGQRFLRYAPLAFDASTLELFMPIWRGATIVIGPSTPLDLIELGAFIEGNSIDACWLTAGLFSALVDHQPTAFRNVRQVLTGGDRVSAAAVTLLLSAFPRMSVVNGYGPTESTTFATVKVVTAEHLPLCTVPIGSPVGDTDVTIAENGEFLIAGRGLATGYWNDPGLTAARFSVVDGRRVYRTGDRISMHNGDLHFHDRLDRQLKIRGYRVEPAAVDETLRQIGAVAESWTFGTETSGGDTVLVCVYVAGKDAHRAASELRAELSAAGLPDQSLPHRFRPVDRLPLTPNGKVDQAVLAREFADDITTVVLDGGHGDEPVTDIVRSIWTKVLADGHFANDDGFFEVGGDSLRLAKLHALLRERFPETNLRLVDLLTYPTVEQQAMRLETA